MVKDEGPDPISRGEGRVWLNRLSRVLATARFYKEMTNGPGRRFTRLT